MEVRTLEKTILSGAAEEAVERRGEAAKGNVRVACRTTPTLKRAKAAKSAAQRVRRRSRQNTAWAARRTTYWTRKGESCERTTWALENQAMVVRMAAGSVMTVKVQKAARRQERRAAPGTGGVIGGARSSTGKGEQKGRPGGAA